MMKYLKMYFFATIFITSCNNDSKLKPQKKYSFPIVLTYKGNFAGAGTAFYYKQGNTFYLVSCRHLFSGINSFNPQNNPNLADNVWFNVDAGSVGSVPLAEFSVDLKRFIDLHKEPDLYKLKLYNFNGTAAITINDMIDSLYYNKVPERVFCYGYDGQLVEKTPNFDEIYKMPPILLCGTYVTYKDWLLKKFPNMKFTEGQNYLNQELSKRFFFISAEGKNGMSGSPVFGEYKVNVNGSPSYVYKLIGVFEGEELDTKFTWVTKVEYLVDYMNK